MGRIFAEHVLTRPFAPAGERKVTRLDAPGVPPIPEDEHVFTTADALIESAGGPLEDAGEMSFKMMHTDSNQHVNSLVYPRVFEEHALGKIVQDARIPPAATPNLLARAVELRWRRPFFAGERARVSMRLVAPEAGDAGAWKIGAVGAFHGEGPLLRPLEKPSSAVKMWFR